MHTWPIGWGLIAALGLAAPGFRGPHAAAQQIAHEVTVVNIEIPVRVFKGDAFIDDLTLADFEITEDGIPQTPLAVYLIKKAAVQMSQGSSFRPDVEKRHFILFFEMDDFLPELEEAIDVFFNTVLTPNDTVRIITSQSAVQLKKDALVKSTREVMARQVKERLRKDFRAGSQPLRSLIEDLRMIRTFAVSPDDEFTVFQQKMISNQIFDLKSFDHTRLEALAKFLGSIEGSKQVLLFYQKEEYLITGYDPDGVQRSVDFEPGRIRNLFADASAAIHFLFLTKTKADVTVEYRESGEARKVDLGQEFYQVYRELAAATGGLIDSSANAAAAMKRAAEAAENYYLLYYQPSAYKKDGKYKSIRVDVKKPGLRVLHRSGYIDR